MHLGVLSRKGGNPPRIAALTQSEINTITEFLDQNTIYENLEELHSLALSWKDYMSDLYFMCQQTNKIIDNFN